MKFWYRIFTIVLFLSLPTSSVQASDAKKSSVPDTKLEQGLDALDHGDWAEAMKIFRALSEAQPDQPAPAYYLGVAAAHGGHDVTAVDAFVQCASLDPSFEWVQANLGLTLFRLDEIQLAEDHLLEALLQGPDSADVLLHLGMIDAQRQEYERALRLYQQSADLDPEIAGLAMLEAAHLELDRGDLPAALDFLEKASTAPGPASAKHAADTLLASMMGGSAEPPRFIIQGSAGFELDDNVTVTEEDLATGLSDEALVLGAGLEYRLLNEETAWIIVGYNFYQSLYRTLTDFDLRIQEPRLTIGGRVGRVFPTFTYAYQNQTLGSDGFLSSHLLDFNLDIALVEHWSLFVGGEAERVNYDSTPARTGYRGAINVGPQVSFFDDLMSFSLIWEPSWQRTDGAAFNFDGQSLLTELNLFIPRGRGVDLRTSYQYIQHDYTDLISGFGLGTRHDTYHVLRLGLQMPLARYANISVDYLHLRSDSTIPDLNYSQNILTFRLGFWYF
ncbi:MAG: tetratricopeptide repeat protein [Myxococcota bacterium]|nr:tetratricopeptide repeat protein [Myxococcota bacterium]